MALLAMDGFESGTSIGFTGTDAVISSTQARTGTYSVELPSYGDFFNLPVVTTDSASESIIVGAAIYMTTIGSESVAAIAIKRTGVAEYFRVDVDAGGTLTIGADNQTSGTPNTPMGTSTSSVVVGWNYIEVEWLSHNSTGIGKLWLNGNLEVDFTGDTQVSSGGSFTDYEVRFEADAVGVTPWYVDDVYILDTSGSAPFNTALGAVRIELLTPDGSVESDFVGSDADSTDNHLLIDDLPMDTTDYIESATSTDRALHGLSDQTLTGTPLAIKTMVYGRDSDGGSQAIDILTKSDLTERATSIAMGVTDNILTDIITLDPDGDVAWTEAQVNALQVGVEVG